MTATGTQRLAIRLNERAVEVETGLTVGSLAARFKEGADVMIRNGFPCASETPVEPGDEIVLIRRGERPSEAEMEALMVARHGPGVHEKVKRARVGIAGCGGLGSALAIALARTGVGRLLLVDFDVVEPSNLNRQQYFIDQLGMKKTEALADNLRRINPYVTIETKDAVLTRRNVPEVFAGCDVVAECFDNPTAKREMAVAVRSRMNGTPLVTVSGIAGTGTANTIRTRRVLGNVFLVGDTETAAAPGRGLLAPRVAVAAGHQANAILRLLLGEIADGEGG
jgi:sulfur carrier protein ThiS adenylyltransferase